MFLCGAPTGLFWPTELFGLGFDPGAEPISTPVSSCKVEISFQIEENSDEAGQGLLVAFVFVHFCVAFLF